MVRVRFLVTVLGLVIAASSFAATNPPRELHFVRDHWTAYNPPDPASFAPGSTVHIIERGDTLWGLAQRYYGDPYLWPQLWENNTYITDAHWIYPGDPLLVQGEIGTGDLVTDTAIAIEEPIAAEPVMTAALQPATPPRALGHASDIYCWGYLGHPGERMPNRIVSFEDYEVKWVANASRQDNGVAEPDIVFVELGDRASVTAGETYIVVSPGPVIEHPQTEEVVGQHYDYRGRVRILCINGNQATAMVVQACAPIRIGDAIKPMPLHPIPLARPTPMPTHCTPPSGRQTGFIVNAKDHKEALGEGNVVEVDLGRADLVEPGTFLTVYRDSPVPGNPRLILGEIGVLTAESQTATGQIIRMRYSMRVGDRVEIK